MKCQHTKADSASRPAGVMAVGRQTQAENSALPLGGTGSLRAGGHRARGLGA